MNSQEIRQLFIDFFASKLHEIVPSAPMVVKDDPTLMFTNAGMNQFKDIFLGNKPAKSPRVADSQKCLRVSGKHNDLEEVGHDTYHHTMFEMLGNWSFGDYFKKEAIDYAWELLTDVYKLPKDRLYATVFEGDDNENISFDEEAKQNWLKYLPENRILNGSKKDNFWEMGESGPCGPCSEIHIDLRDDDERTKIDGAQLVNKSHHLVIEIWNLVFIQYNRKANGSLEQLPHKHVDTGMGFERLCMAVQGKKSNYDTDVFTPIITEIAKLAGKTYGQDAKCDIAIRVIADHLRTISFAIADGQLPYRDGAGYVIRRILRRAVRYGYTFLGFDEPFIYKLLPVLIQVMGVAYPELKAQENLIVKVIMEEEASFLRTLAKGIKRLEQIIEKTKNDNKTVVDGRQAFELFDTYGFPEDLTELMVCEQGMTVDKEQFSAEKQKQVEKSKSASQQEESDWVNVRNIQSDVFTGYDKTTDDVQLVRFRKVTQKKQVFYQLVFDKSPFYAESGGQIGDTGYIEANGEKIDIIDTKKENNLHIHITEKLPQDPEVVFKAVVDLQKRELTECNHSATHLMHCALRDVLGNHVEQKGSLVDSDKLRFDFSHFEKMTEEQIRKVEELVNEKIRRNIFLDEKRDMPFKDAEKLGAMMLFGEKYGDTVRVIKFDESVEFCGGTHIESTGRIGFFKIMSESAIAAGIRRIEAITSRNAEKYILDTLAKYDEINAMFKKPQDLAKTISLLSEDNSKLRKQIEAFGKEKAKAIKTELLSKIKHVNGINVIAEKIETDSATIIKDIAFQLKGEVENLYCILAANLDGKANLTIMIADKVVEAKKINAGNIVREASKEIQGSGGGQANFATAGGKDPNGIENAIKKALSFIE